MKTSNLINFLSAFVCLGFLCSWAEAAPITVSGSGTLGNFSATLNFSPTSPTSGTFSVALTNSVTTSPGGHITAFAFNNPSHLITGATLTSAPANFNIIGGPPTNPGDDFQDDILTSPLDNFDIGASISNMWLGGGNPNLGLAVGSTGTFVFSFTGTGVGSLTTNDFINATVTGGHFFVVRFRGFDNGGSDKVSASGGPGNGGGSFEPIPEPSTVAMFLLGGLLCGVAARAARRRKCAASA